MGTCVLFRSRKTKVRTFAKTRRRRRRSRLNRVRWACCYGEILIVGNYHESDCSCFYAKDRQRTAFFCLKLLLLENVLPVTRWYQTVRTASTNCKWKAWEKKRRTTGNRDNLSTRNTAGLPFTGFSYMRCKNKYTRFLALVNNRTLRTISNSVAERRRNSYDKQAYSDKNPAAKFSRIKNISRCFLPADLLRDFH